MSNVSNYATLPFPVGTVSDNADHANFVGRKYLADYVNPASPVAPVAGGRQRTLILLKNNSTVALLPKRLVQLSVAAGVGGTQAIGYGRTPQTFVVPVDEFIPSTGVPVGSYFYGVWAGPAMCTMAYTEVADITAGDHLVCRTAAASTGATDNGRVTKRVLTGHSATDNYDDILLQIQNGLGQALSTVGSSSTGGDILVNVRNYS
jgi:hypothetical protein